MKKFLALILALVMSLSLVACGGTKEESKPAEPEKPAETEQPAEEAGADFSVAMITDYGDITDQSFNQTTYEACKAYCDANGVQFSYYKPAGDSTAERVAMVEKAVDEGYTVIVMPGFAFAETITEVADEYSDITFVALDVSAGNLDSAYGDGITLTSAMKGLAPTVQHMLSEIAAGNWDNYGGKVETLGLVSGEDPEVNYVQIPMGTTQFGDGFTQDDYKALVKDMFDGKITVSNDISAMPQVTITVNEYGNIK